MPWKVQSLMSVKKEFVSLASSGQSSIAELCRRFGISRKTGYKWINRYAAQGESGLAQQSRKPLNTPKVTPAGSQEAIFEIRKAFPAWGGRKIRTLLAHFGFDPVPAKSTVNSILKRNGFIDPKESARHQRWQRFEAPAPNELWQMDFKGPFEAAGFRCHPLTVLDDHSRYSICLKACSDQKRTTVIEALTQTFRTYGLPWRILCDNGPPWGSGDHGNPYTRLTVWLMRLGIGVAHSRPYHPQTMGKDERFHRTLKAELLQYCANLNLNGCQTRFEGWRSHYNTERPHEALDMEVPASRYRISRRPFPEDLPPIEYGPADQVRKIHDGGTMTYMGREYRIGKAFYGQQVAVRPTAVDGLFEVFFCDQKISQINLMEPDEAL